MRDYIYYIIDNGRVLADKIFSSKQELEQYALDNNISDYDILEWDVD